MHYQTDYIIKRLECDIPPAILDDVYYGLQLFLDDLIRSSGLTLL
jgi:hypothetical protein